MIVSSDRAIRCSISKNFLHSLQYDEMSFNVIVRAIGCTLSVNNVVDIYLYNVDEDNILAIQVTSTWTQCSANEALVVVAVSTDDCIGFQVRVSRLISRIKAHRVVGQLMSSCLDSDMFNLVRQRYVDRYVRRVHTKYLFSPPFLQKCLALPFVYDLSDRFFIKISDRFFIKIFRC